MGIYSRKTTMAYYGYGAPHPIDFGSARLSTDLAQEENVLVARRELYAQLRQSEANEEAAATKLVQDARTAEMRTAEATEQSHRAARAEQIHAAALEEFRRRDAELKAATAAAQETKALFDRASEAARRAEEARNTEVAAAETKAKDAREAEAALGQATAVEAKTADTLSRLQADGRNAAIYNHHGGYGGYASLGASFGYGYGRY